MIQSEQISELCIALAKAQAQFAVAKKSKTNPHLKNKYADLGDMYEATKPHLLKEGLLVIQWMTKAEIGIAVHTRIQHTSGQFMEVEPLVMPIDKATPQAIGSAFSYGKRYAYCALLCIVGEDDDDGNAASSTRPNAAETAARIKASHSGKVQVDDILG